MRVKEILSAVQQRWMSIAVNLVLRQFWLKIITPIKRRCSNSRVPFLFLNGRVFDENVFSKIALSNTFHQNLRRTNFTATLGKGFREIDNFGLTCYRKMRKI